MKNLSYIAAFAMLLSFFVTSCNSDDPVPTKSTLLNVKVSKIGAPVEGQWVYAFDKKYNPVSLDSLTPDGAFAKAKTNAIGLAAFDLTNTFNQSSRNMTLDTFPVTFEIALFDEDALLKASKDVNVKEGDTITTSFEF